MNKEYPMLAALADMVGPPGHTVANPMWHGMIGTAPWRHAFGCALAPIDWLFDEPNVVVKFPR